MRNFIKQCGALLGAGIAAACCLGAPLLLSMLGAVGLGVLVHDAYLLPLFVGFVALSLWMLYRSASRHALLGPFWLALTGGVLGSVGMWLLVTGQYPHVWPVYAGLALLVAGSVRDLINGRHSSACRTANAPEPAQTQARRRRRAVNAAAIAVAAAGAFYGLYKSVEFMAPEAAQGDIACWGINSCKGRTACSTARNACTGQNACKGQGYLNVPAAECSAKGGRPLAGSPGDPVSGQVD